MSNDGLFLMFVIIAFVSLCALVSQSKTPPTHDYCLLDCKTEHHEDRTCEFKAMVNGMEQWCIRTTVKGDAK